MSDQSGFVREYGKAIQKELDAGNTTEHSFRPALKILIELLRPGIIATNEPGREACGAPDYVVSSHSLRIGYIEAKDIGTNLTETDKSEQLERYKAALGNLVLTNYLEFRWYIDGKLMLETTLGSRDVKGKITIDGAGMLETLQLLDGFLSREPEPVGTPKELALHMARRAQMIRDLIRNVFKGELETGTLHAQLQAFRDNLIPELSPDDFADMYAQTIAYGLFAARCNTEHGHSFTRLDAAQNLPKTNPFLRKQFQYIAGYDLDDRIAWLVDDLAQVLAKADMEAVLKGFGKHTGRQDPVIHFYETFLKEYSQEIREMRGVYYTPEPVVSYIVRSIDHLLKTRFGRPQGLADEKTLILDPAAGTGTFLHEVISEIYESKVTGGQKGTWNSYVAEKLLPRIFGFELLMAPYAMAHLKLGLQLRDTGYEFESDQRLGIYLTNTLDEAIKQSEQLAGFNEYIVSEANAAAEIKKDKPIMVVLGNPPYSGISANSSFKIFEDPKTGRSKQEMAWIGKLIEDYKVIDGKPLNERKHWLQDDYVKFIRFGQWRVEQTGYGILGFITNHSYLDNPTFRGMRQSLMDTFSDIYILNLHGNSKKKERTPEGGKDENVFDIQQGVAICLMVKEPDKKGSAKVHYADLWGTRENKYRNLDNTDLSRTKWEEIEPNSPYYFFTVRNEMVRPEFEKGWYLTDIYLSSTNGIVSARDSIVVGFTEDELIERISEFADTSVGDDIIRHKFFFQKNKGKYQVGDTRGWKLTDARKKLQKEVSLKKHIAPCLYRPFDVRPLFYTDIMIDWPRNDIMRHLAIKNKALICPRRVEIVGGWQHVFCSTQIIDHVTLSSKTVDYIFPLYLYPAEGELQFDGGKRRPNLNPAFVKDVSERLGLEFVDDGKGDLEATFGPEDVFNYAYAVFHAPTYRSRYAEFLKIDFPRLPLTSDKNLFKDLVEKGSELVSLHLMESPVLDTYITGYPVSGDDVVEKVRYDDLHQRIYINKTQYFEGVPPTVWEFQVGGYQVCNKWLKDRKGRTLSYDDLSHYQKIVVALRETIRLMEEIDGLIPAWPLE